MYKRQEHYQPYKKKRRRKLNEHKDAGFFFKRKKEREKERKKERKKESVLRMSSCDNESISFIPITKPGIAGHIRKIHLQTSHVRVVLQVRCSQGEPGQYGVHLNNGTIHAVPQTQ